MLPLGGKPAVEYVVEELRAIGISDIIFVVSRRKPEIRDYFGDLTCDGGVRVQYVTQERQLGLADAILQAEGAIDGEPFVVALGDTVICSRLDSQPIVRLLRAYLDNPASAAITVERVPVVECYRYGMVELAETVVGDAFEISGLVEKPQVANAPSDFAIGGRYIFSPDIFDWIRRTPPGAGGEQQITDSIALSMVHGNRVWCAHLAPSERRFDIGSISSYCEAFAAVCTFDADLAASVRRGIEVS
jgi:UTP--glucose-1-phosphate uridylyltransferase